MQPQTPQTGGTAHAAADSSSLRPHQHHHSAIDAASNRPQAISADAAGECEDEEENPFMRGRSVTDAALDSLGVLRPAHVAAIIAAGAASAGPGASMATAPPVATDAPLFPSPAAEESYMRVSVIVLAASFFFNFAMYAPVQNVITTIYPSWGRVSLVFIYGMFTTSAVVAPLVVRRLGASNAVLIGASGYLLFTLSCLSGNVVAFLMASAVAGFCAGIIWTGQGVVLTALSTSANRGTHSALIIASVRGAAVLCNLLLGYLLNAHEPDGSASFSNSAIFLIYFLIGSAGFVCFCILRIRMVTVNKLLQQRAEAAQRAADEAAVAAAAAASLAAGDSGQVSISVPVTMVHTPSLRERLAEIFRLLLQPDYRRLFPILLVSQGMGNSFYFGAFTVTMGKGFLGYAQAAMGCCAVSTIVLVGRRLDRVPRDRTATKKYFLYFTLCMHSLCAFLAFLTTMSSDGYTSRSPNDVMERTVDLGTFSFLVYATCVCFGVAWSGTDICMYYFIGQIYSSRAETAFAGKAFCESIGFVLGQGLLALVPPSAYPLMACIWTLPVLLWFTRWLVPVELLHSKPTVGDMDDKLANDLTDPAAVAVWHG